MKYDDLLPKPTEAFLFGERLKNLREKNKMKQLDLALILDVNQRTISNWEKGIAEPSMDKTKKIAEIFSVSIDYLYCFDYDTRIAILEAEKNSYKRQLLEGELFNILTNTPYNPDNDLIPNEVSKKALEKMDEKTGKQWNSIITKAKEIRIKLNSNSITILEASIIERDLLKELWEITKKFLIKEQ